MVLKLDGRNTNETRDEKLQSYRSTAQGRHAGLEDVLGLLEKLHCLPRRALIQSQFALLASKQNRSSKLIIRE